MFKIDKNRYKITINGIAAKWKTNNNTKDDKISVILKIFKLDAILSSLLNFNENKGILTTKSKGNIIESGIRNRKSTNNGNKSVLISGIAATRIASAGVGKPINEEVCLVSILKLANL